MAIFKDKFNGPDGSAPNPNKWVSLTLDTGYPVIENRKCVLSHHPSDVVNGKIVSTELMPVNYTVHADYTFKRDSVNSPDGGYLYTAITSLRGDDVLYSVHFHFEADGTLLGSHFFCNKDGLDHSIDLALVGGSNVDTGVTIEDLNVTLQNDELFISVGDTLIAHIVDSTPLLESLPISFYGGNVWAAEHTVANVSVNKIKG